MTCGNSDERLGGTRGLTAALLPILQGSYRHTEQLGKLRLAEAGLLTSANDLIRLSGKAASRSPGLDVAKTA